MLLIVYLQGFGFYKGFIRIYVVTSREKEKEKEISNPYHVAASDVEEA